MNVINEGLYVIFNALHRKIYRSEFIDLVFSVFLFLICCVFYAILVSVFSWYIIPMTLFVVTVIGLVIYLKNKAPE